MCAYGVSYHISSSCLFSLQIDIEGGEFKNGGFTDWFSTGVLVNVNQIALELHLTGKEQKLYVYLLKILRELTGMGFRLISQEVNMVVGELREIHFCHKGNVD